MEQQYGSDFISITDEDGKEYELEILSTIEYQGAEYLALVPAEEDEASEERGQHPEVRHGGRRGPTRCRGRRR